MVPLASVGQEREWPLTWLLTTAVVTAFAIRVEERFFSTVPVQLGFNVLADYH